MTIFDLAIEVGPERALHEDRFRREAELIHAKQTPARQMDIRVQLSGGDFLWTRTPPCPCRLLHPEASPVGLLLESRL